mmetsp:Transcript_6845/g.19368  ORF Transcript_6845/g.19368 Transcript_6845/m.19368 type:complete len:233 (-) Transcript_6845:498-1196(-)
MRLFPKSESSRNSSSSGRACARAPTPPSPIWLSSSWRPRSFLSAGRARASAAAPPSPMLLLERLRRVSSSTCGRACAKAIAPSAPRPLRLREMVCKCLSCGRASATIRPPSGPMRMFVYTSIFVDLQICRKDSRYFVRIVGWSFPLVNSRTPLLSASSLRSASSRSKRAGHTRGLRSLRTQSVKWLALPSPARRAAHVSTFNSPSMNTPSVCRDGGLESIMSDSNFVHPLTS